jgi:hypothetical protein
MSKEEIVILDYLRERGFVVEHQYPVGAYNIDLALRERSIAVEVTMGSIRATPRVGDSLRRERVEYLAGKGWSVVAFVISHSFNARFGAQDATKHLIANLDLICGNPPALGEYWVIACCCDSAGRPRLETHQRAAI